MARPSVALIVSVFMCVVSLASGIALVAQLWQTSDYRASLFMKLGLGIVWLVLALILTVRGQRSDAVNSLVIFLALGSASFMLNGLALTYHPSLRGTAIHIAPRFASELAFIALLRFSVLFPTPFLDGYRHSRASRLVLPLFRAAERGWPWLLAFAVVWLVWFVVGSVTTGTFAFALVVGFELSVRGAASVSIIWALVLSLERSTEAERRRVLWLFGGILFLVMAVIYQTLAWYGMALLGLSPSDSPFIRAVISMGEPVGFVANTAFGVCAAATILFTDAFDPRPLIRRTAIYGTLSSFIIFLFAGFGNAISEIAEGKLGIHGTIGLVLYGGVVALLVAPIRKLLDGAYVRLAPSAVRAGSNPETDGRASERPTRDHDAPPD